MHIVCRQDTSGAQSHANTSGTFYISADTLMFASSWSNENTLFGKIVPLYLEPKVLQRSLLYSVVGSSLHFVINTCLYLC